MAYSAITAAVSHEISSNGQLIIITDDTVYRTLPTTPTRAQCLVNFLVEYILNGVASDITPDYDETTVTQLFVPITVDGYYRITMTVTNEPPVSDAVPAFSTQAVQDILVTDRFCACYVDKGYEFFKSTICGCEAEKSVMQLLVLDAQYKGIQRLVATNDMNSAAQALERLALQCAALGCDCGCS